MKLIPKKIQFIFLSLIIYFQSFSQSSPITNTSFYTVYKNDFYAVKLAEESGVLNEKIAEFLLTDQYSNDLKAAVINALSFDILGKENSEEFKLYLQAKYQLSAVNNGTYDSINASDLMSLAYLTIMDDYFSPNKALPIIIKASDKNPNDHAICIVKLLIEAQAAYIDDPCGASKLYQIETKGKNFTNMLLPEALIIIENYFDELKGSCNN